MDNFLGGGFPDWTALLEDCFITTNHIAQGASFGAASATRYRRIDNGDVVRTGMTTEHVWQGIEPHLNAEELREAWRSISPFDYIPRLGGNRHKMLLISAQHDLSFVPEVSCKLWQEMERHGVEHERMMMPCGHYTLGAFPFSWIAGIRFILFLHKHLSNGEPAPTADLEADFK